MILNSVNVVKWLDSLITLKSTCVLLLVMLTIWVLYLLLGHPLIETMYTTTSGTIVDRLMAGKRSTPLEDYLEAADSLMVLTSFRFLAIFLITALLIKRPLWLLHGSCFIAVSSFIGFCLVERFPSIAERVSLDEVRFYYYNKLYVADDVLVHRLRPRIRTHSRADRHDLPLKFGIEVQPTTIEWVTDEDGFRNADTTSLSDIVVIGDGFIEEGRSLADTFANRLEKHLSSVTVRNLGTGGHGPFQYLAVLKRYGIKRNPKYALMAFNEVNDISDVERYAQWKKAKEKGRSVRYDSRTGVLSKSFFERYVGTLLDVSRHVHMLGLATAHMTLENLDTYRRQSIHRDVVLVELGNQELHRMLFIDRLITKSAEDILASERGRRLKEILIEFKDLCARKKIIPMIVFIPSAAHIYAEYSTEQSGRNWLAIRAEQIAAKKNVEQAISILARNFKIDFISLSGTFESAARDGKMLYHPLSTHWNSEGMEIAAAFVADVLKGRMTMLAEENG